MAKTIIGGLLSGLGTGMVQQGQERRQMAEQMRREALESVRRQEDREFTLQRDEASRQFQIERDEMGYQRQVELANMRHQQQLGLLGARASLKGSGAGGQVELTASDRNLMNSVAQNYWGRMNAAGQWMIDPEARDNYAETLSRAEAIAMRGVPVTEAVRIAAQSISGPVDETKAREIAQAEADEQIGGWFKGGEKEEYIKKRVPEIMRESRQAQQQYEQILGGSVSSPSDTGQRTQIQSGQATSQQFASPDDVKKAYQSGDLTRDEALRILRNEFGFE